jgi:hypothetical protein
MKTIYKVLNPINGCYTSFTDKESALEQAQKNAWDFYLLHTHQKPVVQITLADDGREYWGDSN